MKLPFRKTPELERGGYNFPISLDQLAGYFSYNNNLYPYGINQTYANSAEQPIGSDFSGLVNGAYKSNGVVFACMVARQLLFSEARFQFRQLRNGRPGPLFGGPRLAILEQPGGPRSSQTTGDLLARMIADADLSGNWFGLRDGDRVQRLRPDWVDIALTSGSGMEDAGLMYDAEVVGYLYHPGGRNSEYDPVPFLADEIAHFAPLPDPIARFRGMSWLTPVVREIMADSAATTHKGKFFEQGATSNAIVKVPRACARRPSTAWSTSSSSATRASTTPTRRSS